jgi:predicted dehydrogenase
MGQAHAAAWIKTPVTIQGFAADRPENAAALAGQYGVQVYDGLDRMLADVDVVDICAPTDLHHQLALQAAAAGKHVVCEKPLARTLDDAQAIIAACRAAGVKLLVGHVVRYFPEYALAQQKVAAGEIGRPAIVRLRRGAFAPAKVGDNWFHDPARSGGMILDLMIHDFDYARWIAGEVQSVYAQHIKGGHPDAPVDHALAILRHRNGALTHVEGSWAYPPPLFRTQLEIAGSNGWIRFDSGETTALSYYLHETDPQSTRPAVPRPRSPLNEDPYTAEIKSFYAHLAHDDPVRVSAADGLAALQIALAALRSAATGQPHELEPLAEVTR